MSSGERHTDCPSVPQFAPSSSIGVRSYANTLSHALATGFGIQSPVHDRPTAISQGGHFHIANSTRGLLPWLITRRRPVLLTVHDVMPRSRWLRQILTGPQYRVLARLPIVVHSRAAKEMLLRLGVTGALHVIPHAANPIHIPTARMAQLRGRFRAPDQRLLVSAGIQNIRKGVPDMIRAVTELPGLSLVLCGSLADKETRRALDSADGHVRQVACPSDRDFQEIIGAADFLVNFRSDFVGESSGPVALAYAHNVPIIGFNIGAQQEQAAPGDLLFPRSLSIMDCLRRLASAQWDGQRPVRKGSVANWQEAAGEYLRLYDAYGLIRHRDD